MATSEAPTERLRGYLLDAFMAAEERRLRAEEFLQREYEEAAEERDRISRIWRMANLGPVPEFKPDRKVVRSA